MGHKQKLRPEETRVEPLLDADALCTTAGVAHLAQGETALAAAALLPLLDRAGAAGHEPSRLAAALVRAMGSAGPAARGCVDASDHLAGTVQRLTALVREQDGQLARMQAMLDALL